MLSYVCLGTRDLQQAKRFYDAALGALGMQRCVTGDQGWDRAAAGWGLYEENGERQLAVWVCLPYDRQAATAGNGTMVAFRAQTRAEVDHFHAAALAHGGTSEGAPGLRPHYDADFYAAYVRDAAGNKLAAVCRGVG